LSPSKGSACACTEGPPRAAHCLAGAPPAPPLLCIPSCRHHPSHMLPLRHPPLPCSRSLLQRRAAGAPLPGSGGHRSLLRHPDHAAQPAGNHAAHQQLGAGAAGSGGAVAGRHLPPNSVRSPPAPPAPLLHSACGVVAGIPQWRHWAWRLPARPLPPQHNTPAPAPTPTHPPTHPPARHPWLPPSLPPGCRHYLFEGRPLTLFILHTGYHGLILGMSCALLCAFGGPQQGRSGSGAGAGAGGAARGEL
jgi:hypothetical protein